MHGNQLTEYFRKMTPKKYLFAKNDKVFHSQQKTHLARKSEQAYFKFGNSRGKFVQYSTATCYAILPIC